LKGLLGIEICGVSYRSSSAIELVDVAHHQMTKTETTIARKMITREIRMTEIREHIMTEGKLP
jgi:hypothetical protein